MTLTRYHPILLLVLISIFFAACKKGSVETDYNPNILVANNQVIAERAYSDVFNIFYMVVNDSELIAQGSDSVFGAHCTYASTPIIEYRIDFSSYYVPCPDGKIRKGLITATLDQAFNETGAHAVLVFSGYTVENLKLDSLMGISNMGLTVNPQQTFEVTVPAGNLTFIDSLSSKSYTWSSNKYFIHTQGAGTPDNFNDDVFEITGTATGRNVSGTYFEASIVEALGNDLSCRWIRTGKTLLSTPDIPVTSGYIEYQGQDSCTNIVKYTFDGNPFYDKFIHY